MKKISRKSDGTPTVFLSHSWVDKEIVRKFYHHILKIGLHPWIDEAEISPGDSLRASIEDGIGNSDYFVVFFSNTARTSFWVNREVDLAVNEASRRNVPIIPIALDHGAVPDFFRGSLFIDFSALGFSKSWEKLSEVLTADQRKIGDGRIRFRKSVSAKIACEDDCFAYLKNATKRSVRKVLGNSLDRNEIECLWYDLFETRLEDHLPRNPLPNCMIELLTKAEQKLLYDKLIEIVCEDHCETINRYSSK